MKTQYPSSLSASTPNVVALSSRRYILNGEHWHSGHPNIEVTLIEQQQDGWRVRNSVGCEFKVDPEHLSPWTDDPAYLVAGLDPYKEEAPTPYPSTPVLLSHDLRCSAARQQIKKELKAIGSEIAELMLEPVDACPPPNSPHSRRAWQRERAAQKQRLNDLHERQLLLLSLRNTLVGANIPVGGVR